MWGIVPAAGQGSRMPQPATRDVSGSDRMRIVLFCHSLVSDWNHGNAHFLRGIVAEALARGHDVRVFEPRDAWSAQNLAMEAGARALDDYRTAYPALTSERFDPGRLDLDAALDGADVVLVHEWNDPPLVERIGRHRARSGRYVLLFHDTHHRTVSEPAEMAEYDLQHYDAVLAFGDVIRDRYVARGWARRAFTWHEAADVRVFHPPGPAASADGPCHGPQGDLVWIGNWGDGERTREIREYFIRPVAEGGWRARVHGVRYPAAGVRELARAGIEYRGWLPNYRVPEVFARHRATLHIPRRPYVEALPGIPTIRVFEALACGIPLISCWWDDCENLFRAGEDFLMVRSPEEMRRALAGVLRDRDMSTHLAARGRETILSRHTCAHRMDELFAIVRAVRGDAGDRDDHREPGVDLAGKSLHL